MCEADTLSTKDLPGWAVGSDTFKEQSERKNWSYTTKYDQCYMSLFSPIYHDYKPTMSWNINAWVSIFHRTLDEI